MEKEQPKRKRRFYTPEFKYEVLSHYYSHGENRRKTFEKFNIGEDRLCKWIQTYKIEKEGVSLQTELEKSFQMKHQQDTDSQEAMRQRVEALEKALEYERMRCRGYEKLIEIAEKEEGISILKKDGAKQ